MSTTKASRNSDRLSFTTTQLANLVNSLTLPNPNFPHFLPGPSAEDVGSAGIAGFTDSINEHVRMATAAFPCDNAIIAKATEPHPTGYDVLVSDLIHGKIQIRAFGPAHGASVVWNIPDELLPPCLFVAGAQLQNAAMRVSRNALLRDRFSADAGMLFDAGLRLLPMRS